jgi:hypothetical protein
MRKLQLPLVVFLLFAGCATVPTGPVAPIQDSFEIDKPYDVVWKAAVATFAEKSLPVTSIEKDSGFITTDFVIFASGLYAEEQINATAVRPAVFLGTWNSGRYSINIYAQSIDSSKTKIKITPHIEAFENNGTKTWYPCASKGIIEKDIYDSIMSKLK